MRATVLFGISLLVATAGSAQSIKVDTGPVKGTVEDGLRVYRGIPYAAPPVGNLRWRPPQPPAKWRACRREFGCACPQTNAAIQPAGAVKLPVRQRLDPGPRRRRLPVMVDPWRRLHRERRRSSSITVVPAKKERCRGLGVTASACSGSRSSRAEAERAHQCRQLRSARHDCGPRVQNISASWRSGR
jgi:hypothetical protein